ncbi:E3 ubiquitin-protein ligase EL5 [Brachypodium distachyon]|uniref:RING-type domain-containing protein n=1 Tax=Brachypodium distachyon TaxID=15368 RepID=I1GPZ0_BRADI|nr:E3 ubiquitin-protein ligase EL5 [Brachypodium distachyon]KQK13964.1 hypothetical protein BRADI_1g13620v3 [Brachypodium distachyon]|eukprot:XP_010232058.1 E3 ubiquitin-protein ligase EL5 [Brachypodium distachyon]
MGPNLALVLEIAAVVALALLIVIVAVVFSPGGACDGAGGDAAGAGRVHAADVESALGGMTLMTTYEQVAARKGKETETETEKEEERERCALCLGEYGKGSALVRMVPACGHFFHAECGIDGWLRKRRTCPICRGRVLLLPRNRMMMPPLECPPMPPRITASS